MNIINSIQRILGFMMLLIFIISITPKKHLHDWVANHTEFYSFSTGNEATISKTGFNCHCEDLVVSSPFVEATLNEKLPASIIHNEISSFAYFFLFSNSSGTKESRGPPRII